VIRPLDPWRTLEHVEFEVLSGKRSRWALLLKRGQ
jgi:hypothetical protein